MSFSICSAMDAAKIDLLTMFPDLFGCVHMFAKTQGWNSETPLKEMFHREDISSSFEMPSTKLEEHLGVPVQESQHSDFKWSWVQKRFLIDFNSPKTDRNMSNSIVAVISMSHSKALATLSNTTAINHCLLGMSNKLLYVF